VLIAGGVALAAGAAALVEATDRARLGATTTSATGPHAKTPQRRAESPALPTDNLLVLTAAQTKRLVRYASALEACLTGRGIESSGPATHRRSITIEAARDVGLRRLVGVVTSCAVTLGDPPKPSSLQAVDARTIVLSLPKHCLLDPKVEAEGRRS
jgi:hypothetical protein